MACVSSGFFLCSKLVSYCMLCLAMHDIMFVSCVTAYRQRHRVMEMSKEYKIFGGENTTRMSALCKCNPYVVYAMGRMMDARLNAAHDSRERTLHSNKHCMTNVVCHGLVRNMNCRIWDFDK